jgi:hypothetical protein
MDVETWNRPFVITTVCRGDLQQFLSKAQIARLDDGDMERIASQMANAYCEEVFWIDLKIIAEDVLSEKDEEQAGR